MSKLKYSCFIFLLACITSCSVKDEQTKEEKIFFGYLSSNYQLNELSGDNVFLVIPSGSCLGCRKLLVDIYKKNYNNKSFYLIINNGDAYDFGVDTLRNNNVFIDKQGKLDRLDIGVRNAAIIFTSGKKITKTFHLTPDEINNFNFEKIK